ncbi:MAG TPA: glycosyltransferase [Solirubrobacteraceae bacterium]|jgi:GT2 family glycosyltransferase
MSALADAPRTTPMRAIALMENARLRANGPRLWHHLPGPKNLGPLDCNLIIAGAALARSGIESVWVRVGGGPPIRTRHGHPNPDAQSSFPDEQGPGSGDWVIVLDSSLWATGEHVVQALAVSHAGGASLAERVVQVDHDATYRSFLDHRSVDTWSDQKSAQAARFVVLIVADGTTSDMCLTSLVRQTYTDWEAIEADNFNEALTRAEQSKATHAVFARTSDLFHPHILAAFASGGDCDIVYCNEDRLSSDHKREHPFFKPDWSPELLLAWNYIGSVFAIRLDRLRHAREIGSAPLRGPYDALLRLIDETPKVRHIAEVLYTSTRTCDTKLTELEEECLLELAKRRDERLQIQPGPFRGARRLRWALGDRLLVSIVIPTTGNHGLLGPCLRSLAGKTSYERIEVVLVDTDEATPNIDTSALGDIPYRIVPFAQPFHYGLACNVGSLAARGDVLLHLNDDVEALAPDWVQRMLELLAQPGVGVVGANLIYPERLVQHAGVFFAKAFGPAPVGGFLAGEADAYRGQLLLQRNCVAVTGACLMVSKATYEQLGGYDEEIHVEYGDVDLCLRARAMGLRVAWTPEALLLHHESVTRGTTPHPRDKALFEERWPEAMDGGEPYLPRVPEIQ